MLAAIRRHLAESVPHDAVRREHQEPHAGTTPRKDALPLIADVPPLVNESASFINESASLVNESVSMVERFRLALEAVAGRCITVLDEREAAEAVRQIVEQKQARRVAVSDSTLVRSVLAQSPSQFELLENASASELFDCDLGVTSAQWAVAETGTLILESARERHRLASLVPPVHVAIIEARQIRQTLGEVLRALSERGVDGLSRAVTFITGPSRTSDIELTLAIGVHGPAELYVIIIEGENDG
jgi:L-lactate dehydrogenase complex protein LldG